MTNDPMLHHRCRKIAQITPLPEGRDIWIGELIEPIPESPTETHCIHITTPYKEVVFGVYAGEAAILAAIAQIIHGCPVNPHWIDLAEKRYRKEAGND